jgi:hypothetical protein
MRVVRRSTAIAVLLLFVVACASTQPVKQYQAIATCNASAQAATKAFGILYQSEKAKDPALWADRYDKAQAAYASYQKIALAAVDAAQSGGDQTLILAAVNEALNQLVLLLATFGVK